MRLLGYIEDKSAKFDDSIPARFSGLSRAGRVYSFSAAPSGRRSLEELAQAEAWAMLPWPFGPQNRRGNSGFRGGTSYGHKGQEKRDRAKDRAFQNGSGSSPRTLNQLQSP